MSELVSVSPDAFAYGGAAVAALPSGKRCFIRGGAPGDELLVRILSEKKRFASAELVSVQKPSPDRIPAACPLAGRCPGCSYQHVPYETELLWKDRQLRYFLRNILPSERILPPCSAPERFRWRNKIRLTADPSGAWGYLGADNRTVLPVRNCILAEETIQKAMQALDPAPAGTHHAAVTFRMDGTDCIALYSPRREAPPRTLRWALPGWPEFCFPAGSFCQVNTRMAEKLFDAFQLLWKKYDCRNLLELYCGSGIFSLLAASAGAQSAFGIERDPEGVRCAILNAKAMGLRNCRFRAGDAFDSFRSAAAPGPETAVLVDPPRTGLDAALVQALRTCRASVIFYVSCGPDTLARDLTRLTEGGLWQADSAQLFDLFPATAHFETMTVLTRGS